MRSAPRTGAGQMNASPFSNKDTKESYSKRMGSLRVTRLLSVGSGSEPRTDSKVCAK